MSKGIRASMLGVGMMLGVAGLMAQSATKPAAPASTDAAKIARGKYLMTIGACNDCHSPKLDPQQHPDPKRPFSGRPQTTQAPSQNPGEIHASLDLTARTCRPIRKRASRSATPKRRSSRRCAPARNRRARIYSRRCRGSSTRSFRTRTSKRSGRTCSRFPRSRTM